MSVREYIGARYVPIFSDPIQWDNTLSYEPLTVVMNLGTSYVSRQSVPAGIAIDNDQYWVRWADYNAQLEEYIRQVQTYSASISALNDALPIADFDDDNTVSDAIAALGAVLPIADFDSENTVSDAIAAEATARANAIEALEAVLPIEDFDSENTVSDAITAEATARANAITAEATARANAITTEATARANADTALGNQINHSKYYGRKSIGFGDSNMAGGEAGEDNCIYRQICNFLGCQYDNKGVNGARFDTSYSSSINSQVTNATADNDVYLVVVVGGINDFHYSTADYQTYKNQLNTTINNINGKFPNADIVMIWDQGKQYPNSKMLRWAYAMSECVESHRNKTVRIIIPRTFDLAYGGDYYYASQNHPNANGCRLIAERTITAIFGGQCNHALTLRATPSGLVSNCYGVAEIIPDLTNYTLAQYYSIAIKQGVNLSTAFTEILKLPIGFSGNQGIQDKYFFENIIEQNGDGCQLNIRQFDSNYTSTTDSPELVIRNVGTHSFTHDATLQGVIVMRPQSA